MRIDTSVVRDVTWWSWTILIALLAMRFAAGRIDSILVAIAVCGGLAGIDLGIRKGHVRAISVQIRLGCVVLLILGLLPDMAWLHALLLAGTIARVLSGYCLLERVLRLFMPWNLAGRSLSIGFAWRLLITRPGAGGLFRFGDEACGCDIGYTAQRTACQT
jgi:hypothetical protein